MIFLPHTNTVILLEAYCGTITEPGLPVRHAKTELECGTLLLFIHLNLAPAVKENESLMHCINFGGH